MVELVPIPSSGAFVASATEFTTIFDSSGRPTKVFLWVGSRAFDVTSLFEERGWRIDVEGFIVDLWQWFERGVPAAFRVARSIDEYAHRVLGWGLERVRGRNLLIAFSGGKDSTASVLVARKALDASKLFVVYIHMPFLEPVKCFDEARHIARLLGVELEVLEPSRRVVLRYLMNEGLPYRGRRWCTYLKTRPMRVFAKSRGVEYAVVGDRIWETVKRFRRLAPLVLSKNIVKKRTVYLVAPLTIIDVVNACRSIGYVHRHYLEGATRVSCIFCPYKSAYELRLDLGEVEDPGLIDDVLRREWRRWYRDRVDLETFVEEHLWRYKPRNAEMFAKLKSYVLRLADREGFEEWKVDDFAKLFRSVWVEDLSTYVVKDPIEEIEKVFRVLGEAIRG